MKWMKCVCVRPVLAALRFKSRFNAIEIHNVQERDVVRRFDGRAARFSYLTVGETLQIIGYVLVDKNVIVLI